MRARIRRLRPGAWAVAAPIAVCAALAAGCDSGPLGPDEDGRPFVEGRWDIDAIVTATSCGFVSDEFFAARIFQNGGFLEFVVDVSGAGDLRYDGRIDRDGDFFVRQTTFFPDLDIRDSSTVEGRFSFSGRTLVATETEDVTDLRNGRTCRVVWRWRGDRR